MKDYRSHIETLRKAAAETAVIRDLATNPQKRELFAKLTVQLNTLAAEVARNGCSKRTSPGSDDTHP